MLTVKYETKSVMDITLTHLSNQHLPLIIFRISGTKEFEEGIRLKNVVVEKMKAMEEEGWASH